MASVVEQTPVNSYVGDGATTVFPYEFAVLRASDLSVRVNGAAATGITVAGVGSQTGGTVTFAVAPVLGAAVVLERDIPLRRDTDYTENGDLRAEVLDQDFNLLWQVLQEQGETFGRALLLPRGSTASTSLPAPEADKFLAWDSEAGALVNRDATDLASVVVAGTSYCDIFTPTDLQTQFTLSADPGGVNALDVHLYGVPQINGVDFTVSGTTLTMTTAPGLPPSPTARLVARYTLALPEGANTSAEAVTVITADGVDRAVGRILFEVIRVTDYFGVDPLGVVNSGPALQRAINDAVALAETGASTQYSKRGVGVFFPDGEYLINTPLVIDGGGVTLFGNSGIGPRLRTTAAGAFTMFTVGLTDDSANTFEVGFRNLNFYTGQLNNTNQTAIAVYRSFLGQIVDCAFYGWNRSIEGNRMNRWFLRGLRTFQSRGSAAAECSILLRGSASGTGGGIHMSQCEFAGGGTLVPSVTSHIKIQECDGLYAVSVHTRDCAQGLEIAPDGTTGKNIIDSLRFANCYFDENATYNLLIEGTLAAGGRFQQVSFNQCYFRGGIGGLSTSSTNNVRVRLTSDGVSPFDRDAQALTFTGCDFRTTDGTSVVIQGSDAGRIEMHGVILDACYFQDNLRAVGDTVSGIVAQCESITITNCVFDNEGTAPVSVVSVNLSGPDSNRPSATITNNDASKSLATGEAFAFSQATSGYSLVMHGNTPPGRGKHIDQSYRLVTTNATTTTAWQFVVAQGMSGNVEAEVCGVTADGSRAVVYTFRTGFRRNAGGTTLSTGSSNWSNPNSWNPDSIATIPTATLSTNTLLVQVTGQAATTFEWNVHIRMTASR